MSDFIFRVDDFRLTKEQENRIAGAIRGAVVTELARLDLSGKSGEGPPGGRCLFIPINWLGGYLLRAVEVGQAEGQTLGVTVTAGGGER